MATEQGRDDSVMTYEEVLRGLSARARDGHVAALVALERALRRAETGADVDAAIARILEQSD